MIHCAAAAEACRLCWIAGRATFTIVPSMNAMLEPRMAASSVQRCAAREHGVAAAPWRMAASSHGVLARAVTAGEYGNRAGDCQSIRIASVRGLAFGLTPNSQDVGGSG